MATTTTFTGMGLGFAAHTATAAINTPHTSKQRARRFIDCDLKCRDQGTGNREQGLGKREQIGSVIAGCPILATTLFCGKGGRAKIKPLTR
jgi:hypothetical protein